MTYRWINIGVLAVILVAGAVFLWLSRDLALTRLRGDLEPIMFPASLAAGMVILCLIEVVRTLRSTDPEQDASFEIPGALRLVLTILFMAAYFFVWQQFGLFYPATAGLTAALILLYRGRVTGREAVIAGAVAIAFALVLYLVFQMAFNIDFTH